jgi:hypothetical protein
MHDGHGRDRNAKANCCGLVGPGSETLHAPVVVDPPVVVVMVVVVVGILIGVKMGEQFGQRVARAQ